MLTVCQITFVYAICNLEQSSTTSELVAMRVKSEENGRHVNIICCQDMPVV